MDVVQFVDQVSASPTVRLNLNNEAPWAVAGIDLSPPRLKAAYASTLLVDGERMTAAAYANRTLTLTLELIATQDASASALQALWRELDRPTNLLRYQPDGATSPVFFRTLRSMDNNVRDYPGGGGTALRTLQVEIEAEPFALGLRESLSMVTVSNDPAAGSNGMFFDVTSPKGDVEAPLYLSVRASDVARVPESPGAGRRQSAIAVRRGGTPSAMPAVVQAESMTAGTDTSVQAASGSSGTFLRTSFATATSLQTRASAGSVPASPSTDARGTYRVFLRCRKSVSGDAVQVQMRYVNSAASVLSDLVTVPEGTVWRWVDMGLVQLPLGYDPVVDGLSGTPLPAAGVSVHVRVARAAGTGTFDMDVMMFAPADDRLCLVKWPDFSSETAYVVDPVAGQAYGVGASGEVRSALAELIGGAPMVSPGVANRVWMWRDVSTTYDVGDDVTASMQVTPYYWPRYLHVRPVAS